MKKNLLSVSLCLALSAMASSAFAKTLSLDSANALVGETPQETITSSNGPITWNAADLGGKGSLSNYMLTFTFVYLKTSEDADKLVLAPSDSNANNLTLSVNPKSSVLKLYWTNSVVATANFTANLTDTFALGYDSVTDTVFLMNQTQAATNGVSADNCLTLTQAGVNSLSNSKLAAKIWTQSASVHMGAGYVYNMDPVAGLDPAIFAASMASGTYTVEEPTQSVPEPATATLSLLALAGIAARRRRK